MSKQIARHHCKGASPPYVGMARHTPGGRQKEPPSGRLLLLNLAATLLLSSGHHLCAASSNADCRSYFTTNGGQAVGWWLADESSAGDRMSQTSGDYSGIPDDQEIAIRELLTTSGEDSLQSSEAPDTGMSDEDVRSGDMETGVTGRGELNPMLCCVRFERAGAASGRYVVAAHEHGADGRCFDGDTRTGSRGCGAWTIRCGDSGVEEIELNEAELGFAVTQTIPNSLGSLTAVTSLDMSNNDWTAITSEIHTMESLQVTSAPGIS